MIPLAKLAVGFAVPDFGKRLPCQGPEWDLVHYFADHHVAIGKYVSRLPGVLLAGVDAAFGRQQTGEFTRHFAQARAVRRKCGIRYRERYARKSTAGSIDCVAEFFAELGAVCPVCFEFPRKLERNFVPTDDWKNGDFVQVERLRKSSHGRKLVQIPIHSHKGEIDDWWMVYFPAQFEKMHQARAKCFPRAVAVDLLVRGRAGGVQRYSEPVQAAAAQIV